MNTKVESKFSILFDLLNKIFRGNLNKARIKFIGLFIIALRKVQTLGIVNAAAGNRVHPACPLSYCLVWDIISIIRVICKTNTDLGVNCQVYPDYLTMNNNILTE